MDCIAHRGFAETNPENTLAAVRAAVESGADGIEVDVRRCGSGELVVIHDETVDRVTDGTGRVDDHSLAALSELSVLDTGEGVPSLDAVCRAVPPSVRLVLELKEDGLAADAVAVAHRHDCNAVISALDADRLREAPRSDGDPTLPLALVFHDDPEAALRAARRLDCAELHPHWGHCTESLVAAAHEQGLTVCAWTATSPDVAADLAEIGVDGLMVDAPTYCR